MSKSADEIRIEMKHDEHNALLNSLINDLERLASTEPYKADLETILEYARANTRALLFLCQERKRDRQKMEALSENQKKEV